MRAPADNEADAEIEASELARRVTASDVSGETLDQLERPADEIAMAYAGTPPDRLLPRVRRHLDYVGTLVDARKTRAGRGTSSRPVTSRRLWSCRSMPGDRPGRRSALIQATAREGRAWARLGEPQETSRVLARVEHLAEQRTPPEHPEHHYRYGPAKAHS